MGQMVDYAENSQAAHGARTRNEKKTGTYFDGHGLALRVGPTGAKSWIFRYTGPDGKRHDLGLGPTHTISLAEARELALQARKTRRQDKDPLAEKREARQRHRVSA